MRLCEKCKRSCKIKGITQCSGFSPWDQKTTAEKLAFIKSFKEPPFKKDDPFYERNPWSKFGGVSSGICQSWLWYINGTIMSKASESDIDLAYREMQAAEDSLTRTGWTNLCNTCIKKRRCGDRGCGSCAAYVPIRTVLDDIRARTDDEWIDAILRVSPHLCNTPFDLTALWCSGICDEVECEECDDEKRKVCVKNWLNSPVEEKHDL